jgi:hypothetical protein
VQDVHPSSLVDLLDPLPLLWATGGVLLLFAVYILPLLVCAVLCRGRVATNANRQLDRFFRLFHALIECFKRQDPEG